MKITLLIVIVAVLTLGWLLSRTRSKVQGRGSQVVPEPVQAIKDLRNQLLTSPPEALGFSKAGSDSEVWGILMETGYPEALATLVSLRDGTASLYLGHGGNNMPDQHEEHDVVSIPCRWSRDVLCADLQRRAHRRGRPERTGGREARTVSVILRRA